MIKPITMALVAGILLLVACSKSSSNPTQKSIEGNGTWNIESILAVQTDPLSGIIDTVLYSSYPPANAWKNGSANFESNDSVYWNIVPFSEDTIMRYKVLNSQSFVQGIDTMHIQTLTDSLFIFYEQQGGYKATFTLIPAN